MNDTRRWIIGFSLILIVPMLFVVNVWQSHRFVSLQQDLETIQNTHLQLLEENKRLVVGIAGLRSPTRVRTIAEEDLGLSPVSADRIQRIEIDGGSRGQ
ncbi:MAG: cell division protein FtsL [Alkalispirochaeta sp.]